MVDSRWSGAIPPGEAFAVDRSAALSRFYTSTVERLWAYPTLGLVAPCFSTTYYCQPVWHRKCSLVLVLSVRVL